MPITYRIDREQNLIRTHATGVLTDSDILAHKARLFGDPDFRPGIFELSDARGIDRLEITPAGIRAMIEADSKRGDARPARRLALVVSADAAYGMARLYQTLGDRETGAIGVFRSMEDALAWLDRP